MDITDSLIPESKVYESGKRFWFKNTLLMVWVFYPLDITMVILNILLIGLFISPAYWKWRNRIMTYSAMKQVEEFGAWGINLWSTRRRYAIASLIFLSSLLIIGLITIVPFKMICQTKDTQYEYMKVKGLLDKDYE